MVIHDCIIQVSVGSGHRGAASSDRGPHTYYNVIDLAGPYLKLATAGI